MGNQPKIKIIAISNVFCRSMHFEKKGDYEIGHCHTYDHGTLVAHGKVLVEMLRDDDTVISGKEFTGPAFVFITKLCRHRITALEDNTVAACIHAMRDVDSNILSPEFFIDEKWFADVWEDSDSINDHYHLYTEVKRKVSTERISLSPRERDEQLSVKGF